MPLSFVITRSSMFDLFSSLPRVGSVICCDRPSSLKGNSSVTHVTFFQFFYFHQATIKHLVVQSNKFKAYGDLGVQFYITT